MLKITKPARAPKREVIGAKVSPELKAAVEKVAQAHGVSVSVLIEQALSHALELIQQTDASKEVNATAQEESAIAKAAPTKKRGRPRKGAKQRLNTRGYRDMAYTP